ncbi:hypothetical protein TELCIR_08619, partial [Teladorsagia circumcincta]
WKTHGSEYYECSRYKENPSVAAEANHVKARRALEKYLHYYERFENHSKSLKLEQQFRDKIQRKIEAKVNDHDGTWIDWQYLHNAATLLTKCRYTLQYTYPFAYFMENGARKQLVTVTSALNKLRSRHDGLALENDCASDAAIDGAKPTARRTIAEVSVALARLLPQISPDHLWLEFSLDVFVLIADSKLAEEDF